MSPRYRGEAGSDVCTILNEAYDVLMDDNARAAYDAEMKELERMTQEFMKRGATGDDEDDEQGGYTGEPLSEFKGKDPRLGTRARYSSTNVCASDANSAAIRRRKRSPWTNNTGALACSLNGTTKKKT